MLQPISYVLRNLLALVFLTGPVCFIDRAWGYVSATNPESYLFDTRRQRGPLPGASSSGDHSPRSYTSHGLQNQPVSKRLNRTQSYSIHGAERSHSYKQKPRRLILLTNDRHTKYVPDDQWDQNKFLPEKIQRFDKHGRSRASHHRPGVHLLHKITTTKRSSTTTQRTSQTNPLVTSSSTVTSPTTATTVLTTSTMSSSTAAPDSTMESTTTEAATSSSTATTESTTFASSDDPTSPSAAISTSAVDATLRPCKFQVERSTVQLADSLDDLSTSFSDRYVAIQPPFPTLREVLYVINVAVDAAGTTGSRSINFYICAGRNIGVNDILAISTDTAADTPVVTVGTGTGGPVGPNNFASAEQMIIVFKKARGDCSQSANSFTVVTCVGDPNGSCNNIADSCQLLGL